MSDRGGHPRGAAAPGLQPMKATVHYQLSKKPRAQRRDGKPAGKSRSHQLSSGMRRTMSLDAFTESYLQGHWLKDPESQSSRYRKDKYTQTPDSWSDKSQSRRSSSSHKRSASLGSDKHLQEFAKLKQQQLQQCSKPAVAGGHDKDRQCAYPQGRCSLETTQPIPIPLSPLSTLAPRLRCSVEGLNQELEGMFTSQPPHPQQRFLEIPDGHRAPIPPQSCSSGSQCDLTITPLSSSSTSSSSSSSPNNSFTSQTNFVDSPLDQHQGSVDCTETGLLSPLSSQSESDVPLLLLNSSSPGPNKSCCFQRDPPEGCEKVRVWEETRTPEQPKPALISSCPDPNKVNFTPHGGSAFCPVRLLKPLLPSMDLLFRGLSISPTGGSLNQGTTSCQAALSSNWASPADPPATNAAMGENSGEELTF